MHDTTRISNRFTVSYDYPVIFTDDAFSTLPEILGWTVSPKPPRTACRAVPASICLDSGLVAANPAILHAVSAYDSAPMLVPGGAAAKNDPALILRIIEKLASDRLDRHGFVIAIGGGSVLDAVGFAAALFHRGVRLVRIPSTVLAQADAGIGVKNGIDFFSQKNILGAFAPPFAVINDRGIVQTLPRSEMLAGLSECVKVGIIRDADFFVSLENALPRLRECELDAIASAAEGAARIHLRQITEGGDPFERGSARPLDFGHWAAHRMEVMSEKRVGHGAAVAAGMALDTVYAHLAGLLSTSGRDRILELLRGLDLPLWLPEMADTDTLLRGLEDFREHLGGELCVTLPIAIGATVEVSQMDHALVRKAVNECGHFRRQANNSDNNVRTLL